MSDLGVEFRQPGPKVLLLARAPSDDLVRRFREASVHEAVADAYFALVKDKDVAERLSKTTEGVVVQPVRAHFVSFTFFDFIMKAF